METDIATRLLDWYQHNGRVLPWRIQTSPYSTWVSEIMLQQTRVETVIPYFQRWMARFPNVHSLAQASEEEVLRYWEGLGYYSRARNLHAAAGEIVQKYDGFMPANRHELEKMPGIGRYTAAAIASIAFGMDEVALDGNVRRVLARLFDVSLPSRSSEAAKLFWEIAEAILPHGQAGDFNQAMMDLGALICTPRRPWCTKCPLNELCRAYQLGLQESRPVTSTRPEIPHYDVTAAVVQRDGEFLIARRPSEGLLGGMWEFPGGKQEPGEDLEACLRREIKEEMGVDITILAPFGIYKHAYTHFRVTLHAFLCRLNAGEPRALEASQIAWVVSNDLANYPMGKLDRQIANKIKDQIDRDSASME
jgi:A/G-specific adenine glycosylase